MSKHLPLATLYLKRLSIPYLINEDKVSEVILDIIKIDRNYKRQSLAESRNSLII